MISESVVQRTGLDQFRHEFSHYWRAIPCKPLFLFLLAAWIALFHFLGNSTLGYVNRPSLFGWLDWVLWRTAAAGDDGHGPWMLLVVLALLWWKRKELYALPKRNWWPALSIIVVAILVHALGYMVQQTRISIVGFFVGIYGLIGLVWGPRMLWATFFPMFLFAFCVPLGGTLGNSMTLPLRILASKITQLFCHWVFGINVIQDGTRIFDSNLSYNYDVAAACSGIRSLTATLAVALIYAFVMFKSHWRRMAMIAATVPLAIVANVCRLSSIIIASEAFGRKAGTYIHESWWASLLPYIPLIGGVLLLGHWLREKRQVTDTASAVTPSAESGAPSDWTRRDLTLLIAPIFAVLLIRELVPAVKDWTGYHPYSSLWILTAVAIAALVWLVRNEREPQSVPQAQVFPATAIPMLGVGFVLIIFTGFALHYRQAHQKLGQPGLKLVQMPTYDPDGKIAGTNSVALPEHVLNFESKEIPVDRIVLDWLPKDTTYGQRAYSDTNGFYAQLTAVLMGTDRTSIHQPQYCLTGNGWRIDQTELEGVPIHQPHSYELPVKKLTVSRTRRTEAGSEVPVSGVYVYWFVADHRLTAEHGQRMLDMGLEMLRTGVLQRWAYVSCFSACAPGRESETYHRMKELIAAAVPQFQLATGQPAALVSN